MKKFFRGLIIGSIAFAAIMTPFALKAFDSFDIQSLFYLDGSAILPLESTWTFGSSGSRIDAYLGTADIATASIGSLSSGDVDMGGYDINNARIVESQRNALTNTIAAGLQLVNATAATVGSTVQNSPALYFKGAAWDTDGSSADLEWNIYSKSFSSATPYSELTFRSNAAGGYDALRLSSDGTLYTKNIMTSGYNYNTISSLAATTIYGQMLANATAAADGVQQVSPATQWRGFGWKTTATAASQAVNFRAYTHPVQGTTAPTGNWILQANINDGSWSDVMTVSSSGRITAGEHLISGGGYLQNGYHTPFGLSGYGSRALSSVYPLVLYSEQTDAAARKAVLLGSHTALTNAASTLLEVYNSTALKFTIDKDGIILPAGGYKSADGTAGASATVTVKGSDGNNCNIVFKNGLYTSTTCP